MIIYQVRTMADLCPCKKYVTTRKEIPGIIKEAVEYTKKFRKSLQAKGISAHWTVEVTKKEVLEGVEVVKINTELLPEYERILGKEFGLREIKMEHNYK